MRENIYNRKITSIKLSNKFVYEFITSILRENYIDLNIILKLKLK